MRLIANITAAVVMFLCLADVTIAQTWEQTSGPYGALVYAPAINASGEPNPIVFSIADNVHPQIITDHSAYEPQVKDGHMALSESSSNGHVTLEAVTNVWEDTMLIPEQTHRFTIRFTNIGSGRDYNIANGFRIYSPDGATWTTTIGSWLNDFDLQFNSVFTNYFGVTGMDADTVGFAGIAYALGTGLVDGWDAVSLEIEIGPTSTDDAGKHVCIDSCWFPPSTIAWRWDGLGGTGTDYPSWSGDTCFKIADCGVDSDGDGIGDLCDSLAIAFAATPLCGSAPLSVSFTDSSSSEETITGWYWEFGDDSTSSEMNPVHQYQQEGAFDVTLTVTAGTLVDTFLKEGYVVVQASLGADFGGLPTSGLTPLVVTFDPLLEGVADTYIWDFGDGDTSYLPNPIHIYDSEGLYDVKLQVQMELEGCNQMDSITKSSYISVSNLHAAFTADPTAGVGSLEVQFTDQSTGPPDSWYWDFGDGNTSTLQNPVHNYDSAGYFDVFLRVTEAVFVDSLLKLNYIHSDSEYVDLLCEYFYSGDSRPGFDATLWTIWTNIGTDAAEACLMKVLLPSEVTFQQVYCTALQSGTCSPHSFLGDTIVIPLSSIVPSSRYGGYSKFLVTIDESVPLGDTLVWEMWLSTSSSDNNQANNYCILELEVIGSIDPNDKSAFPAGRGTSNGIDPGQSISYLVQFENKPEATAEAIYVRVLDSLDEDLDWSTLAVGAMSHDEPCSWEFDPYSGIITWFCDSIMLPPNNNPPEGEGYFTYSISPKAGLPNGTEISNTAWIRFDYNPWLMAPEDGPVVRTIYSGCCIGLTGNVDNDPEDICDLGDLTKLIDYLFISFTPPTCMEEANVDGDVAGIVDLGDLTALIDYLFISFAPPAECL